MRPLIAEVRPQFGKDIICFALVLAVKAFELPAAVLHAVLLMAEALGAAAEIDGATDLSVAASAERRAVVPVLLRIFQMPVVDERLPARRYRM